MMGDWNAVVVGEGRQEKYVCDLALVTKTIKEQNLQNSGEHLEMEDDADQITSQ